MAVWQTVELVAKQPEPPTAATLRFSPDGWPGHRAGQHVDVRLTADDGYQAQRSYSIASAPDDGALAITVERLDDGEVSPYLVDDMAPGDALELRGPIGGGVVWEGAGGRPLLLRAGGAGGSCGPAPPGARSCSWRAARDSSRSWPCCVGAARRAPPCRHGCCSRP